MFKFLLPLFAIEKRIFFISIFHFLDFSDMLKNSLNASLELSCPSIAEVLWMPSHSYCPYDVSIFGYVHHFLFWQRQFNLIWFDFLSSLAPVHQPLRDVACIWRTFWCYFCPCHIFSVVSIAILSNFLFIDSINLFIK